MSNVEQGISNDEVYSSHFPFGLHHSLFEILRFAFEILRSLQSSADEDSKPASSGIPRLTSIFWSLRGGFLPPFRKARSDRSRWRSAGILPPPPVD
jgi:hypothetical protein